MNVEMLDAAPRATRVGLMTYATMCAGLVALLFLTNWPTYQYAVRGGPIPLYFYILPAFLIIPLIFAEPATAVRFVREPLFWWFVAFVTTGLIWLLFAQDFMEDASRQWRLRGQAFLIFYTVGMLALDSQRRVIGLIVLGCALMASAFNWFDVLRPYRFVPEGIEGASEGRGAGLFINPNAAGSFVVAATIAALPFVPTRFRGAVLVAGVFGVAATFSRGAFVMVAVALLGAVGLKLVKRVQGILLLVALPLLFTAVSVSYDYLIDASESRHIKAVIQRLNWFSDSEDDGAVEGRKYGARQALEIFLDNPMTGKGPGAASLSIQQEGPHNMYVLLMAEQGILGLLLYVSLCALLLRAGRRLARAAVDDHGRDVGNTLALFGMFMATYGFFSHNVLEEPFTVYLMGFLVAAAFDARRAPRPHDPRYLRPRATPRGVTNRV
jgi:O-antigen ligase